jgi:hypothetical protein
MTGRSRYTATSVAFVGLTAAIAWPMMAPSGRISLLTVGICATLLQVILFTALSSAHGDAPRFVRSWALGISSRLVFVVAAGGLATLWGRADVTVAVLSAAGFVFVLHLVESAFLGTSKQNGYAR